METFLMATILDIISDPICPWCYIGKVRLDRALEARPHHTLDLHWRPFQLNPDMPAGGMDRRAYLEGKFGGPDEAARIYGQIAATAEADGIEIDLDNVSRTPNTIDAHRLIRWSRLEGRQSLIVNQLFHRYFRKGQDISDHAVLIDIAETAGMDADLTARLLASDNDIEEVRAEDAQAREIGVQGVPTFIVGNRHVVSGAQDTDLWLRVIDEIAAISR